jgi:hypothetical protein
MVGGCVDQVVKPSSCPSRGHRAYGNKKIYGFMITETLNATAPEQVTATIVYSGPTGSNVALDTDVVTSTRTVPYDRCSQVGGAHREAR